MKLRQLGIAGSRLNPMQSYLSGRSQFVRLGGFRSDLLHTDCGRASGLSSSFEITFILRHVKVKLFWFTVNQTFMIYLPLLCGRPEVLQGDYSFEVLQGYAFLCPGWLTLACKCTRTLKQRSGQKTLYTSALEGSVAPLKCHLDLSQRIICFAFLPFPLSRRLNSFSFQLKNERREKKKMSFCAGWNNRRRKSNFVVFEKRNASAYQQNVWRVISAYATVLAEKVYSEENLTMSGISHCYWTK